MDYTAPRWLPGGHLQTIAAALLARALPPGAARPTYQRQRWDTPDGDFIDLDWLPAAPSSATCAAGYSDTLVVLFHGLEGSSASHYALAFAHWARAQGFSYVVPHFRGCSGEMNRAPRAYHSGDWQEIDWILRRLRAHHRGPLLAIGVSLGGNALMRWAAEMGAAALAVVDAVCSICAPLDLTAGGHHIGRGFNRISYTPYFLKTMKAKALAKLAQYPGLFNRAQLLAAKNLYQFDNIYTAPLHGFKNTDDYWRRASAKPLLKAVRAPALLINARNDPFMPVQSLPKTDDVSRCTTLWQPEHGGHVGFAAGRWPGHLQTLPRIYQTWVAGLGFG